jgi:DNA-binding transcriptional regulator PaaX
MKKIEPIKSPIKKKILILLAGGVALGLARNPRSQRYIFKTIHRDLKRIDRGYLIRIVKEFKEERLLNYIEKKNGSVEIVLSEKGKRKVLEFNIDNIKINKPIRWDKKWRMVMFDIPEKRRVARNILREKLKEIGFREIQKSVFIHPYPCFDEINFITEYFQLRRFVRFGEMVSLSNEEELRLKFKLF